MMLRKPPAKPQQADPVAKARADFAALRPADPQQPTDAEQTRIVLAEIQSEQARCTRMLPLWRRNKHIECGGELSWATNEAVALYQALSAGQIAWREAWQRLADNVSRHTTAFELALAEDEIKREYAVRQTKIAGLVADWIRRKWWLENIDGTFEVSAVGQEHLAEMNEAMLATGGTHIFIRTDEIEF